MPEIVLKPDGRVLKRPFEVTCADEREIQIDDAILECLTGHIARKSKRLFSLNGQPVGVALLNDNSIAFCSVRLPVLNLNSTIKTDGSLVIPSFEEKGDYVTLRWTPPMDMKLIYTAKLEFTGSLWQSGMGYIFAFFSSTQVYRVPLPNVYNDCSICNGRNGDPYAGDTIMDCFSNSLSDFNSSKWNADLIHDSVNGMFVESQRMFRFEPTSDGFNTIQTEIHWTKLSRPVGTDVLNYVVL